VADEVNGTWNDAIEVPGTAALNTGTDAGADSVSCASAGNCAVGGSYADSSGDTQAFVADEVNGTWNDAIEPPGTGALNTGGLADIGSVSCSSAGNCAASGEYSVSVSGARDPLPFVVSEVDGTWGDAIQIPGTATNADEMPIVTSVSCPSAGNCTVGGDYNAGSGGATVAFVDSEIDGSWGDAIQVPGTPVASTFGGAAVYSLSCPPSGGCAAGGYYLDTGTAGDQAFVVSQN
jgi:hypothetical protein